MSLVVVLLNYFVFDFSQAFNLVSLSNLKNLKKNLKGYYTALKSIGCKYYQEKRVILIDSVYRKDENYYPKVFLEKFGDF